MLKLGRYWPWKTVSIHLKRHLATFNLQLDRVQSDGDCAFRTIMRQVRKLVHNEAGQLSEHLRRLGLLNTEDLDTYTLRQLFVDAVLADDCSISNFVEGSQADVERKAREFSVRGFFDQEIGDFVIRLCSNILQVPIMVITSSETIPFCPSTAMILWVTPQSILLIIILGQAITMLRRA